MCVCLKCQENSYTIINLTVTINEIIMNNKNQTHAHYSHDSSSDDDNHQNNNNNNNHGNTTTQKHKKTSGSNNFGKRALLPSSSKISQSRKKASADANESKDSALNLFSSKQNGRGGHGLCMVVEEQRNYQDLFESCRLDLETVLPILQDGDEQTRTHIVRKLQKTLIKMNNYLANENDLSMQVEVKQVVLHKHQLNVSRNRCTSNNIGWMR